MTIVCDSKKPAFPVRKRQTVLAVALAVFWLSSATLAAPAAAMSEHSSATLAAIAAQRQNDYRQQQWQRLAAKSDRDSLIAATLIGLPSESPAPALVGQAELEQRLAELAPDDPMVRFVLAVACQAQAPSCQNAEHYDALLRLAPDNAVHWLLLPSNKLLSAAQLRQASRAKFSDTHARELAGIVRAALREQPMVAAPVGTDPNELALRLRRNVIDALAAPSLVGAMVGCRAPGQANTADCIALARQLMADRSGAILPTMVGSAMIRRLLKGTQEAAAAVELRRHYVWLSVMAPLNGDNAAAEERLYAEMVQFGEWEAWQRRLEREGSPRQPPSGWTPPDPQVMLLAEDRVPATTAK